MPMLLLLQRQLRKTAVVLTAQVVVIVVLAVVVPVAPVLQVEIPQIILNLSYFMTKKNYQNFTTIGVEHNNITLFME